MANIKNFGIVGIGAGVQFGKGGAQLIQTAGTFAAKNATGNAFVRFQIADGASTNDAVSYQQFDNAVTLLNSTVSNTIAGAGLNPDGSYSDNFNTNYIASATSLYNADVLLDSALTTFQNNITAELENDVTTLNQSITANAASVTTNVTMQLESELAANVALINANSTSNYNSLVSLIGTTQNNVNSLQTELEAEIASNVSTINNSITSNVATLQGEIDSNYTTLQGDITSATTTLQTTLEGELASNVVTLNNTIGGVQDSLNASITANAAAVTSALEGELAANVATLNGSITANAAAVTAALEAELAANVATLNGSITANAAAVTAALESELAANVATLNGSITANATVLSSEISDVVANVADIQGSYVNKDGSVAMTGALDLGNNAIHNVATGVAGTDAVNVEQLTMAVASLSSAFDYMGTVTPNAVIGDATVLPSGADAGAYYKATTAGYLIGAEANSVAFFVQMNDGVVRNTSNVAPTWDTIAHVDSQVYGTAGYIDVTGSVDTGFTVNIDPAYGSNITNAIAVETARAEAAEGVNANAIAAETTRAEGAESALSNAITANAASVTAALEGELAANVATVNGSISANVATLNGSITANAASVTSALEGELAANVATLEGYISANAASVTSALEGELAANVATINNSITSNVTVLQNEIANIVSNNGSLQATIEGEIASNVATINGSISSNVATINGFITSNVTVLQGEINGANTAIAANAAILSNAVANIVTLQGLVSAESGEIANIVAGAGLQTGTGNYVANAGSTYLTGATSLFDADNLLDNAVSTLALELATLSQDTIKTTDGLNSVHVGTDYVVTKLNVGGNATVVSNVVAGANTNSYLGVDLTNSDEVVLGAYGTDPNVDLRLVGQGSGHVIIGETGVGVIQADTGYDMTVAGGTGANLNLLGDTVNIGEADSTTIGQFTGTAGATGYLTFANGNTAVTVGAAGTGSNIDLVFAPKGTGAVNVSGAKVINVANATNSGDAVNYGQLNSAVSASLSGVVSTFTCTLPATSGSVSLGTVTGTVLSVKVLISATYDAGSTITVDDSATAGLAASTDIDESTVGIYMVETLKSYSAQPLVATVTNATGLNGAATVVVEYIHA